MIAVTNNQIQTVGVNQIETVGSNQIIKVGSVQVETIGLVRALTVGVAYQTTVRSVAGAVYHPGPDWVERWMEYVSVSVESHTSDRPNGVRCD